MLPTFMSLLLSTKKWHIAAEVVLWGRPWKGLGTLVCVEMWVNLPDYLCSVTSMQVLWEEIVYNIYFSGLR